MIALRKLVSTAMLLVLSTAWGIAASTSLVHAMDSTQRTAQAADTPPDCTKNPDDRRCTEKK